MTRTVVQTIFDTEDGPPGNCLQAAVASLLELPLAEVPHFVLHKNWSQQLRIFLRGRGFALDCEKSGTGRATGIAIGTTVRGTHHAVVFERGRMVWDPHPSGAGLKEVLWVFVLSPLEAA